MKNYKIKSYCKINLFLRITKKLNSGYHSIASLITFCEPHDIISISKTSNLNDKISFTGDFKKGINTKSNTATDVLNLLRQKGLIGNQKYKINIQKNIPHGSGLGGGSSNAANLLNYFNKVMKLRLDLSKLEKLASQIGSDVPISLIKKNTFLSGKKGKIQRLKKKFKLNLLIVYPNVICSTKKIYMRNKKISPLNYKFYRNRNEKLINLLKKENNDLEKTVIKMYPKINKVIKYIKTQKGCYFSRITGSGSACIGIFSNMKNALYAKKLIKIKYPKYWCVVSKTM